MPEPIISIKELSFSYTESNPVLTGINLEIPQGDFLALIGPNGGGKTTLLRLMLGLLQPACGQVLVLGSAPHKARSRLGYVPQHFDFDRAFPVAVCDVVRMGLLASRPVWGRARRAQRALVRDTLQEVMLLELADRPFSALSGGERQRVLIARALVGNPELLLLDEPTANVDYQVEVGLYELLKALNERMTVVVVTHDLGFVSTSVKRVACVNGNLHIHPTGQVDLENLQSLYPERVCMVMH